MSLRISTRAILLFIAAILFFASTASLYSEETATWQSLLEQANKFVVANDKVNAFVHFEKAYRACDNDLSREQIIKKTLSMRLVKGPDCSEVEATMISNAIIEQQVAFLTASLQPLSIPARIVILNKILEISPTREKWVNETISAYSHTFVEKLTPEEQQELDNITENKHVNKLDDIARSYVNAGNYRMAIKVYWAYILRKENLQMPDREKIMDKINVLMQKLLTEVTPDEQLAISNIFNSPSMTSWQTQNSMKFIVLGEASALKSVDQRDLLVLDLAYILASDFLSNDIITESRLCILLVQSNAIVNNSALGFVAGTRAFDASGKLILLEFYRAISAKLQRDNMGYYGFALGVRKMCEIYQRYMLENSRDAVNEALTLVQLYRKYYVNRPLDIENIASGEICAGLFFSVMQEFGMKMGKAEWLKIRTVFDILRTDNWALSPRYRARDLYAYIFAKVYDRSVYKMLQNDRFGVVPESYNDFATEAYALYPLYQAAVEKHNNKEYAEATEKFWEIIRDAHPCPLVEDCYRMLLWCNFRTYKRDVTAKLQKRLGIITEWMSVGPIYPAYTDRMYLLAEVLGPDEKIAFGQTFPNQHQVGKWGREATDVEGRYSRTFSYPNNYVCYSVVYINSPVDTKAWFFHSSNQPYRVTLNGDLVGHRYINTGGWRFDNDRFEMNLRKGVNRLLVKFAANGGAIVGGGRVVGAGGSPIPDLTFSIANCEDQMQQSVPPTAASPIYTEEIDGAKNWHSNWRVTAGSFVNRDKIIYPMGKDVTNFWFPQFPDSKQNYERATNIAWLKTKKPPKDGSFALSCTVGTAAAAHGVAHFTFDGEGEDDPLSGISVGVIRHYNWVAPQFAIYEYDVPVFTKPLTAVPAVANCEMTVLRSGDKFWVTINKVPVFVGLGVRRTPGKWPLGITMLPGVSFSKLLLSDVSPNATP